MRLAALIALLMTAGCGENSTSPAKGPPLSAAAPPDAWSQTMPSTLRPTGAAVGWAAARGALASRAAKSSADAGAPSAPADAGHLEGSARLARLFEGFSRLEAGHSSDDVRIVQYGDSHTASDTETSVFRRILQTRFGDGGRGFVALGKPWKTYWQEGVRGGMSDGFEPFKVSFHNGTYYGLDGCYGLLGVGIVASKEGERAWDEINTPTTRLEIDYWQAPGGGSFDVFIDGTRPARVATRSPQPGSGFATFDLPSGPHQVELRTVGDGEVRLFGMVLERAQAGVVVDAVGINGAQIFTPLRWNEAHFIEQLRHRAPDLVVVAYGTNESLESRLTDADYEHGIVEFLGRVARAAPTASCMILGPPDRAMYTNGPEYWTTAPRLVEIVAIQRRVAAAAGCAFYDQFEAMGGRGSMAVWAAERDPRGLRDRMHLTQRGYAQIATSLADDLLHAYDAWRIQRGLSPTSASANLTSHGVRATPQTPAESRRSTDPR